MTQEITFKEKLAFSLGGLGQNIVYNVVIAYVMVYYTDVAKLSALAVGTLMLVSRIWDAVNDPIMGSIVDRTKTKWGKLKPYLIAVPIPMAIFTVLVYLVPNMNDTSKLIYAYITFNLWCMTYTVSDIPYWALSVACTTKPKERLSLISMARIFCNIGLAVSILIPPLIIKSFGGGQTAYLIMAIGAAIIGPGLFSLVGIYTKDRMIVNEKPVPFKVIFKNTPLLILQSSRILGSVRMVIATAGLYFAKYNLHDEAQFSILGGILIASMIFAMFFTPGLARRFSKKKVYIYSLLLGFFAHLTMFIMGYNNVLITYVILFFCGMSLGMNDVVTYTMVGDSVDYLEDKIGFRTEGLSFSMNTFTTILQSSLGLFVIGLVLTWIKYVPNSQVQTSFAYTGIFSLISLLPALACLLSIIPMLWYSFTEAKHEEILSRLHPNA